MDSTESNRLTSENVIECWDCDTTHFKVEQCTGGGVDYVHKSSNK